ncbi:hypothetical protein KQI63_03335 [bacterium]|nr:hypothetical protein [bacterium]
MERPMQRGPEGVPSLSIRDLVALATRQLKGTSRQMEDGFCIDVRDYPADRWVEISLHKSPQPEGGTNLKITVASLKTHDPDMSVNLVNVGHLYVTWQTKGMISFCYAGDGRYKLINVTYDNGVVVIEDVDKRRHRSDEDMSESERRARAQRRTFYHIGPQFDKAEPHDSGKPMEGSVEAEEANLMKPGE